MPNAETLGVGLYSVTEAARLLQTPRRTLSRWVEGYVGALRSGPKRYRPVLERDEQSLLSFGDLVELMYVRGFRRAGVGLEDLRRTAAKYRAEWETPYPLATKRFATDGRQLLIDLGGDWTNALSGQRQLFFDAIGRQLIHVGDLASEWRPLGADRAVVLNPGRSFGKPIDDQSGTRTSVLASALETGEDAESVSWWYGTTPNGVRDAAEFESLLASRPIDGDLLLR